MKEKNLQLFSFIEIILAGMGFGFLGIFGKTAFAAGVSVGELLSMRFVIASLLLWAGLAIFRPHLIKLSWKQIIISSCLGVFGYSVFGTMYFKSIQGVSVAIAAMLLFTFPIFVNIGSVIFFKEQMHIKQWFSLVLSIVGLVILLWGDMNITTYASIGWGLGAGITYAIYVLVSGHLQKNVPPLSSSLYVITAAAVALWCFHQPDVERILHFHQVEYLCIVGIAIVSTIMPLTLFLSGMQKISSSKASIIVMIEPVTAAFAGWFFLDEQLGPRQIIGGGIILAGLFLNRK